jgi:hypothetical protein
MSCDTSIPYKPPPSLYKPFTINSSEGAAGGIMMMLLGGSLFNSELVSLVVVFFLFSVSYLILVFSE